MAFNDKAVDLLPIDRFDDDDLEILKKIAVNDYPLNDMSNPILVVAEEKWNIKQLNCIKNTNVRV